MRGVGFAAGGVLAGYLGLLVAGFTGGSDLPPPVVASATGPVASVWPGPAAAHSVPVAPRETATASVTATKPPANVGLVLGPSGPKAPGQSTGDGPAVPG